MWVNYIYPDAMLNSLDNYDQLHDGEIFVNILANIKNDKNYLKIYYEEKNIKKRLSMFLKVCRDDFGVQTYIKPKDILEGKI